jgi:WXXGXW repeat (2 copies)
MRRWGSIIGFVFATIVLAISVTADSRTAHAQIIGVNITIAPPELPVYDQPPLPDVGYIWIPGYWAWGPEGYYWVPGYWELPPAVGLLWTPGYWGWHDGYYAWNEGYWGPQIGFYGGVNYGFGYTGTGYYGGHWDHGVFAYNQTVNNFGGVHVTNVYNQTVVVNNVTRVSFNGGTGGITARPTPQELEAAHEHHVPPTAAQTQHQQTASSNPALRASENHGRPAIAAVSRPNEFSGKGVVAAHEAAPANFTHGETPGGGPGPNPNAAKFNPNERTPGTNPHAGNPAGTPEKPAVTNLERKEPVGGPPKPTPPQPHIVTAPNPPHPAPHPPAPHPQARPAPHPPAPHPQARPAPHPNNKKPT